jgi:hypothetical protein
LTAQQPIEPAPSRERPGWRDVPMPRGIRRLKRGPNGMPVPWIAAWSSERENRITRCPMVGMAVFTKGRQGEGRPVFGEMHPARQRQAVIRGLCQTCGERLPDRGPLLLAVVDAHVRDVTGQGGRVLVIEPFACRDCLSYSVKVCPGLVRAATLPPGAPPDAVPVREEAGVLLPTFALMQVTTWRPIVALVQLRDDGGRPIGPPACSYLKIEIGEFEPITTEELEAV